MQISRLVQKEYYEDSCVLSTSDSKSPPPSPCRCRLAGHEMDGARKVRGKKKMVVWWKYIWILAEITNRVVRGRRDEHYC